LFYLFVVLISFFFISLSHSTYILVIMRALKIGDES
jgi:hypothetical protein